MPTVATMPTGRDDGASVPRGAVDHSRRKRCDRDERETRITRKTERADDIRARTTPARDGRTPRGLLRSACVFAVRVHVPMVTRLSFGARAMPKTWTNLEELAATKASAVALANDVLSGRLGIIEGSRLLAGVGHALDIAWWEIHRTGNAGIVARADDLDRRHGLRTPRAEARSRTSERNLRTSIAATSAHRMLRPSPRKRARQYETVDAARVERGEFRSGVSQRRSSEYDGCSRPVGG